MAPLSRTINRCFSLDVRIRTRSTWLPRYFSSILLCFTLFQQLLSSSALAAEIWLIYAEEITPIDSTLAQSASIGIAGFQYFGYVVFPDPSGPPRSIDSQPTTIKAKDIYNQVFKTQPAKVYAGKPTINRKDDTQIVLYSAKRMNFVCTKKEDAFTQVDAPVVSPTGIKVEAARIDANGVVTTPEVRAFLCDLESRDKGNTRITFTIEKNLTENGGMARPQGQGDNTPKKEVVLSQAIRVHELYRFRITSGPVFSSLITRNRKFSTVPTAGGGQVISSSRANDAPANFPIFLKTYIWSRDGRDILVPPQHWYERINPVVGINLVDNPLKNFYAGLSVEPFLGVDIVAGAHFGKVDQLAGGFVDGQPMTAGTQPATTSKFLTGGFVGVTADVGVIGSWLGSQITKTIKEGLR